jgi:hypothetical protein|tara:strand:- start:303 stop:446 length:144 start_codon:yes stop_codon:yes gene_type:complete
MKVKIMFEQPNWYIVLKVYEDGEFEVVERVDSYDKALELKNKTEGGE